MEELLFLILWLLDSFCLINHRSEILHVSFLLKGYMA